MSRLRFLLVGLVILGIQGCLEQGGLNKKLSESLSQSDEEGELAGTGDPSSPPPPPSDDDEDEVDDDEGSEGDQGDGDNGGGGEQGGTPVDLGPITSISAGPHHVCYVRDGHVFCWGSNEHGQVGPNLQLYPDSPTRVKGVSGVHHVVGGTRETCATHTDGRVTCWGSPYRGDALPPTQLTELSGVEKVEKGHGAEHSCALLTNGKVMCWGSNGFGQLGRGDSGYTEAQVALGEVTLVNTVQDLAVGDQHTCTLVNGQVKCFGRNFYGQFGNGESGTSGTVGLGVATALGLNNARDLSCRTNHCCAVLDTKEVSCWGNGYGGQVGNGLENSVSTPYKVPGVQNALDVEVGQGQSCVLLENGQVKCWGYGVYGALGHGLAEVNRAVQDVQLDELAKDLTLGYEFGCAVLNDDRVQCWGQNDHGQLGRSRGSRPTPTEVTLPPIQGLFGGVNRFCAIAQNGQVHCWGANTEASLRNSISATYTLDVVKTPYLMPGWNSALSVAAGYAFTCMTRGAALSCVGYTGFPNGAQWGLSIYSFGSNVHGLSAGTYFMCGLTEKYTVYCLGHNDSGSLGIGSATYLSTPEPVIGGDNKFAKKVIDFDTHNVSSCVVLEDFSVSCWGHFGGFPANGEWSSPVNVPELSGAAEVAVGSSHTCARMIDGTVRCFGTNRYGQRGFGEVHLGDQEPQQIAGLSNVVDIDVSSQHSCVVLGNGEVWCWGRNRFGQIGDGTHHLRPSPSQVQGIDNAVQIKLLDGVSCALLSDGRVKCWGSNRFGVLGIGEDWFDGIPRTVQGTD